MNDQTHCYDCGLPVWHKDLDINEFDYMVEPFFNMVDILLKDADRCMDAYESGADRSDSRLSLAKSQIYIAFERGAEISDRVNRLLDICFRLDSGLF